MHLRVTLWIVRQEEQRQAAEMNQKENDKLKKGTKGITTLMNWSKK